MLRTWWARGRILEGVFNYSERYGILRGGTGGEETGVASGRKRERVWKLVFGTVTCDRVYKLCVCHSVYFS